MSHLSPPDYRERYTNNRGKATRPQTLSASMLAQDEQHSAAFPCSTVCQAHSAHQDLPAQPSSGLHISAKVNVQTLPLITAAKPPQAQSCRWVSRRDCCWLMKLSSAVLRHTLRTTNTAFVQALWENFAQILPKFKCWPSLTIFTSTKTITVPHMHCTVQYLYYSSTQMEQTCFKIPQIQEKKKQLCWGMAHRSWAAGLQPDSPAFLIARCSEEAGTVKGHHTAPGLFLFFVRQIARGYVLRML